MSAELVPTVQLVQLRPRHVVAVAALMIAMVVGALLSAPGRAAACDGLSIPSVAVERCIVDGDQTQIDAGSAVRYTALSSESVHWLAGHRTSHGGTFGALVGLTIGDQVTYRGTTYAIDEYRLVDRLQSDQVSAWVYADTPTLVLQTSAHGSHVHVWHAVPVVAQMAVSTTVPAPTTVAAPEPVAVDRLVSAVVSQLDTLGPILSTLAWV